MNLKELALSNKGLIEFIKSRTPGELTNIMEHLITQLQDSIQYF